MEMPGRRSNYTLISQFPDDQPPAGAPLPYYESSLSGDHRANRIGNMYAPLQRESSGSSFGESSFSGEYNAPTLSTAAANDLDMFGYGHDDVYRMGGGGVGGDLRLKGMDVAVAVVAGGGGSSSGKSWAQQTEESYQLQLALALRLSSEATCADDPNFLDPVPDESASRSSSSGSAEAVSHRFWVNGCLSYSDKIPDGFYLIHGMNPYVWTVCTDLLENGRIPTIESLKSVDPSANSLMEVVLIDRRSDPSLKEFQNRVLGISRSCITTKEVVDQLAKLVCSLMGGSAFGGEDDLISIWMECCHDLKDCLGSVVVPIGSLSVGLCRHRALLFKVLADMIDLPCRIAKGCKYCTREDAASCLVRFGLEREYLVDLIGKPGHLCEPSSLLNGPLSISISSPLRFPRLKPSDPTIDFRSLAKQYFADCQMLNLVFDDPSTGIVDEDLSRVHMYPQSDARDMERSGNMQSSTSSDENPQLLHEKAAESSAEEADFQQFKSCRPPQNIEHSAKIGGDPIPHKNIPPSGHPASRPMIAMPDPRVDASRDSRFADGGLLISQDVSLDIEDLKIPWSDLELKERIGAGSFGTVHRADWHGSEVAVKILMEQDFHAERFREFLREVAIMKRLRHPNIVLFMGAVTEPPKLSIVTEYLSRGSLYRLLHKPGAREMSDERRRLNMALDVAKGMNYLHKRNPPIVHRDLKSPNLLVDKKYTVKVCDFGLSRLKPRTFLSSKSAAGTPEWMAPEVLRDEPSNEKSDVYSFGVILGACNTATTME
ncbi:hypothetical protein BT93_K0982 [Corymbia citriodora subsp. variegata]|nr:hypothetical protein BT93_K0982 [Corymbia citriodora subsp. variegata]